MKKSSEKRLVKERKIKGGILTIIGYMLSPLSWWNDIFVNIPLAYIFAFPFALISKHLFLPTIIVGYLSTNIAGLILMHHGITMISKKSEIYTRKKLIKGIVISILYTLFIIILIKLKIIKFPFDYFK